METLLKAISASKEKTTNIAAAITASKQEMIAAIGAGKEETNAAIAVVKDDVAAIAVVKDDVTAMKEEISAVNAKFR